MVFLKYIISLHDLAFLQQLFSPSSFSTMLQQATEDLADEDDIDIRYRTNDSLFHLRSLQAKTKTQK